MPPPARRPGRKPDAPSRTAELSTFLFLAFVLVPGLSIAGVGGLGLAIWIWQMFAGPPGPPPA